ncbi:MAG: hypothetical protein BWY06_00574 [Candidatus Latescibacteria bacterium ADurb.Bin168]|nr:MAG: hypothetical protein BWY06_00574 [Candidatus Latescibacteria bacterium ADurb.Bin168]
MDAPRDIGDRLELFVDEWLIDELRGARQVLHQPVPREPALVTDRPWEGNMCHYVTVLRDGARCRMYYSTWHAVFDRNADGSVVLRQTKSDIACAESLDGKHWHRPDFGLYEAGGSRRTNIVWTGEGDEIRGTHGFAPFIDTNPACPADQRYKAVGRAEKKRDLWAMASPDGIHWRILHDRPIFSGLPCDSQNLAFYDALRGEYRAYLRDFDNGVRGIKTATSPDFARWTEPKWLEYPGAPVQQLYTNQIMPYPRAPHLLLGFPTRYTERPWSPAIEALPELEHRKLRAGASERYGAAVTDGLFMSSRDGRTFHRWNEAFLRPGLRPEGSWAYGDMYQAWGLLETESDIAGAPPELSLYAVEGYWRGNSTVFRRYTLRMDGFVSVNAPFAGGEMITKPFTFAGSRLALNMSTAAAGGIRVEMQDPDGRPLEGFALDDSIEVIGDELARTVSWRSGADVSRFAGQPVRLRFVLSDADLYAMQFADAG